MAAAANTAGQREDIVKKLNIAVIGAGRLGGFHAEHILGLPHVELTAVVDPSPAARNRLAAECSTQALAEPSSLLGHVDAAVIAAPTRLHHELAMAFLESGVHLLVEKPLAATLAEANELVETAPQPRPSGRPRRAVQSGVHRGPAACP